MGTDDFRSVDGRFGLRIPDAPSVEPDRPNAANTRGAAASATLDPAGPERLIRTLSAELQHVLTSRRWRAAMALVRLRNRLARRPAENPLENHLYRHLRAAGREVPDVGEALCPESSSPFRMPLVPRDERRKLAASLAQHRQEELVSVIMPTWNRADELRQAIRSVQQQSYRNWELLVIDDGSVDWTATLLEQLRTSDRRIRFHRLEEHLGVSAARNAGMRLARGNWLAYLDSDNRWDRDYLLLMLRAIRKAGHEWAYGMLEIVDLDRNSRLVRGDRFDFARLLRNNYIDLNVLVHSRDLASRLGGFDEELRRWVDWDLILRFARDSLPAEVPEAWCTYRRKRSLRQITALESPAFRFRVLNKHLVNWSSPGGNRLERVAGLVSIVIPNRGLAGLTSRCVRSILKNTEGHDYEIVIVDNGSPERCLKKLRALRRGNRNLRLIENPENFGFALGCNLGAAEGWGEFVVWLNNDTRVAKGWLRPLIEPLGLDPRVGIVGPKLLFPGGRVQHAGLVFGPRSSIPYSIYRGFPQTAEAVCRKRTFQAITGACMSVRWEDVAGLKGFDPLFRNGCEDVDFCLRMSGDLGKKVFYNPESVVYHDEGKTPGRARHIRDNRLEFVRRWGDRVRVDDADYYTSDGYRVSGYRKRGGETERAISLYEAVLVPDGGKATEAESVVLSGPSRIGARSRVPGKRFGAKRPIRVGLVTIWHERGVSFVADQLAEALDSDGFQAFLLARGESERFSNSGAIRRPRVVNGGEDPSPARLRRWVHKKGIDLVIFVEVHPNDWKRVEALAADGIPILAWEHLDVLRKDMLDRYHMLDGFLSGTFFGGRVLRSLFPDKPCLVLPWGVRPSRVETSAEDAIPRDTLRWLHIAGWGGLQDRKNTELCIRAFHAADLSNSTLTVFSQAPLTKYGDSQRIAAGDARISLHEGTVENISSVYPQADVLLWPSKREGLGLPIVEALASGLAVAISDGYMMKEWPVLGEHAWTIHATPDPRPEPRPRWLPLLEIDCEDLIQVLRKIDARPDRVSEMKRNVRRDRRHWLWDWQPGVLRTQIRRFMEGERTFAEDRSHLPAATLEFEALRSRSRRAGQPPPPAGSQTEFALRA